MKNSQVLIEWIDSKGIIDYWEYKDELEPLKPAICYSIGFLIEDNPEYKTIAQTVNDTQILGRMTIPVCAIVKLKKIKN